MCLWPSSMLYHPASSIRKVDALKNVKKYFFMTTGKKKKEHDKIL